MHASRKHSPKAEQLPWRLVYLTEGECLILADPSRALATLLGSCIAACVRDPGSGIGGMNHFLLPGDPSGPDGAGSLRYGVNAMEALMNQVASRAAVERSMLEIKVFGGANIEFGVGQVGHRNADFIEAFLAREGLSVAASHLRGTQARRIVFHPASGKVLMRHARAVDTLVLASEERRLSESIAGRRPVPQDIELFG